MKSFKSHILLVFLAMFFLTSCEDYFGDINEDPDNPLIVTPGAILPQVQVRLAYALGGDASRYTGIYTQHIEGVTRQFVVYQNYGLQGADVDNLWSNLYSGIMADNRQLQIVAAENGYVHYMGIAKAVEAYALLLTTDLWGDIPYSQAFQGTAVLQPTFDTQQSVYESVFALIESARTDLAAADGGALVPGNDDLIYGGNLEAWGKFLSMLEARAYLHLGEVDNANYASALDAVEKAGVTSGADDARLKFGSPSTENAPWYQYIQQRDDIEIDSAFVSWFSDLDPRNGIYTAPLELPHPYFTADQDVPILTYTEIKFIEAETQFRAGGAAAATPAYLDAVRASMADAGVTDGDAIDAYIASIEGDVTLEAIMLEKTKALFADQEAFSDWRRTGIPSLIPNTGTDNEIPVRLPYPQTEIFSNANTPSTSEVNQFTPVWWDK